MKAMKCFSFSHDDENGEPKTPKSTSLRSSMSNGQEGRKSGSDFTSMDMSDSSTVSSTRVSFTSLTQNPSGKSYNNLREFSITELKTATRNFSRALMIGEGGFGGVYRAVIQKTDGSGQKIDVAIKQLSRRGLQGHKEWVIEVNVLGFVDHPIWSNLWDIALKTMKEGCNAFLCTSTCIIGAFKIICLGFKRL